MRNIKSTNTLCFSIIGIILMLLTACQSDPDEVVVANTPTPTATFSASTALDVVALPTPTSLPSPTPITEPQINRKTFDKLNSWGAITPPTGWNVAEGANEFVVVNTNSIQDGKLGKYVSFSRWGNQISDGNWSARFPDAIEEKNSSTVFRMAGKEWIGVFIQSETEEYRAFWGYTNGDDFSYTVTVFVSQDGLVDLSSNENQATINDEWEATATDINTILKRFSIN